MASFLQVGKRGELFGECVCEPVPFVAIRGPLRCRAVDFHRSKAPFVIIRRAFQRAFAELESEAHRRPRRIGRIMDFHLERLVLRQVLLVRIKSPRRTDRLSRRKVLIRQDKGRFLQRGVRLRVAFRLGIRAFVIRSRVFAVVDSRNV